MSSGLLRRLGAPLLLVLVMGSATARAHHLDWASDAELRAALVLNFARFATWPTTEDDPGPLVIGVVEPDPFGDALAVLCEEATVSGRSLRLRRFTSLSDVRGADLLYVPRDAPRPAPEEVDRLLGASVLLVGEGAGFLDAGGIIEVRIGRRARFRVSASAAERAGIRLSSQLLRLAESKP